MIDAPPQVVFDAFLAMYGDDRPDWILDSELDLRVGGTWSVAFHPPGVAPFREERVVTELDPPQLLGYRMTAVTSDEQPTFCTAVTLSVEEYDGATRVALSRRGFRNRNKRDDFAQAWPGVLEIPEGRI